MAQKDKRPNGTGSVYERKDGTWVASITVAGKRVVKYAKTRRAAELLLAELLNPGPVQALALVAGTRRATPTLATWADQWLTMNSSRLRAKTQSNYRKALKPVLALAGPVPLGDLTPLSLVSVFTQLQRDGRGPRAIQQSHTVLRTCLEAAVNLGVLPVNPMACVPKPQWHTPEKRYWTVAETRRFLDVALTSNRKWSPLCALLVLTGLRLSEGCGLTWEEVDLARGRIRVSETQVYVEGEFVPGPPKSKAGRRWVALDKTAVEVMTQLRDQGAQGGVFRTRCGRPPVPGVVNRELKRLCDEAQVPVLTPHGLRHVQAMLALKATRDPYVVQRRLGHSHVSVTLGIYGYSLDQDDTVSQALDQLLSPD